MSGIPSNFDLTLHGIPSNFHASLDNVPTITLDIKPLTLDIKPLTLEIKPVTVSLDVKPVDVSLRLKEIPSIRAHVPADFTLALSVAGFELACLSLCGEAQLITEPYHPNPCEICGQAHDTSSH
jgi:hypothetical protein